jgi:hypothetical protein
MIERYTIKFGPAVSQKELQEKLAALQHYDPKELDGLHKMKARIEVICDFGDLRAIKEFLEQHHVKQETSTKEPE